MLDYRAANRIVIFARLTSLPPAVWGRRALGCAAADLGGGCVERATCMPTTDADARVCVFREGDHACSDDYPSRVLRYRGLSDERCEICCDGFAYPADPVPGWPQCRVDMGRYDDPSCTQPSEADPDNTPECRARWSASYYSATGDAPERASCLSGPVASEPVNPVVGEGTLTICCVE